MPRRSASSTWSSRLVEELLLGSAAPGPRQLMFVEDPEFHFATVRSSSGHAGAAQRAKSKTEARPNARAAPRHSPRAAPTRLRKGRTPSSVGEANHSGAADLFGTLTRSVRDRWRSPPGRSDTNVRVRPKAIDHENARSCGAGIHFGKLDVSNRPEEESLWLPVFRQRGCGEIGAMRFHGG